MAAASRFIVVEIPSTGLPVTQFTQEHPDVSLDIISEPPYEAGGDTLRPMLFMIRGASGPELRQVLDIFAASYDRLHLLSNDPLRRVWIGRGTIRQSGIHSPAMQGFMHFQSRIGPPWFHSQGGVVHVRAAIKDPDDGERLLADMQGHLATIGAETQADLQDISAHDYSVWDDLVQFSIGLSPTNVGHHGQKKV